MPPRKSKETPKTLKIGRIDIAISNEEKDKKVATFDINGCVYSKGSNVLEVYKNCSVKIAKNTLDIGRVIGEELTKFITETALAASCASVELE